MEYNVYGSALKKQVQNHLRTPPGRADYWLIQL